MNRSKTFFLLAAILVIAAFFRFWDISRVPPGLYPDEAMNGNNALESLESESFSVFYTENNGREGLYINAVALSLSVFGNEPWAIRLVSAVFGLFTVLGMFFLGRELFGSDKLRNSGLRRGELIALAASFFMAVSFWHINFSRVGFRAVMAPFFLVWGLYFLWIIFRKNLSVSKKAAASAVGGFLFGAGAHSYIAYRISPLLLFAPFRQAVKNKTGFKYILLFLLLAVVAFAPLGIHYMENPQDFLGRTSQVSIFSEPSPARAFLINSAKTFGSFWFSGDQNPRHNFPGKPLLWWPVGILFALGLIFSFREKYRKLPAVKLLWLWLFIFILPVAFSSEGIPHALRSILLIPAVMFIAGIAFVEIMERVGSRTLKHETGEPAQVKRAKRIRLELLILLSAFLAGHIVITYNDYFLRWPNLPETGDAFSAGYVEIGLWLRELPEDIDKYLVVNADGVLVETPDISDFKPVPMPAQTVMFLTNSWPQEKREQKNIRYILPENLQDIKCPASCAVVSLESEGRINEKIKEMLGEEAAFSIKPGFGVFYRGFDI